jgi:hypothetical protein
VRDRVEGREKEGEATDGSERVRDLVEESHGDVLEVV